MANQKLTDKLARDLPPPTAGAKIYYDADVPGFGLRVTQLRVTQGVTQGGARSFVLNYRTPGRERRLTIGSFPAWTVRQARDRAAELRRLVDAGIDPLGEREAERVAPTINELADLFTAEHLVNKRATSQAGAAGLLRLYVRPRLGRVKVAAVTHAVIADLHRDIASGKLSPSGRPVPYQANRCAALLSTMFAFAIKRQMRADNPTVGIARKAEERRERYLSPAELARLGDALAAHPERVSADAIRLLLLTGARRGETLGARWAEFDLGAGTWTKPSAHTKTAKLHRVPLSAPALALLTEMRTAADQEDGRRARDGLPPIEWVFPGTDGRAVTDIKKSWASLCRRAAITGARLHDLRHTYASVLVSSGLSLPIIGALLGHTQPGTTARYAHLADDPLRRATETAGAILTGAPGADVVAMRRRNNV